MINITNDAKKFFDTVIDEEVWIYGNGNAGIWLSYFMSKTGYSYAGFIDRKNAKSGEDLGIRTPDGEHMMIHPADIPFVSKDKKINMIITSQNCGGVLEDINYYAPNVNAYCLTPIYKDILNGNKEYDINHFLSFFRRKLLKDDDIPTIISNTCSDGMLYHALGLPLLSPSVNTAIEIDDFLKIAHNPEIYLKEKMLFSHWWSYNGKKAPAGKVGDVTILFAHTDDADAAIEYWNGMRMYVNWNNLIFILSDLYTDYTFLIDSRSITEFSKIKHRHLLFSERNYVPYDGEQIYSTYHGFLSRESVMENYFDVVTWISKEA